MNIPIGCKHQLELYNNKKYINICLLLNKYDYKNKFSLKNFCLHLEESEFFQTLENEKKRLEEEARRKDEEEINKIKNK